MSVSRAGATPIWVCTAARSAAFASRSRRPWRAGISPAMAALQTPAGIAASAPPNPAMAASTSPSLAVRCCAAATATSTCGTISVNASRASNFTTSKAVQMSLFEPRRSAASRAAVRSRRWAASAGTGNPAGTRRSLCACNFASSAATLASRTATSSSVTTNPPDITRTKRDSLTTIKTLRVEGFPSRLHLRLQRRFHLRQGGA